MSNVLYLLPIAAATGLAAFAGVRARGRVRVAWRLLAVSTGLWFAGEVVWSWYDYVEPQGPPVPSAADIGYLLQYVIALPAILIGVGVRGTLGRARGFLDALLVAAAVAGLGWHLVIGPLVPGSWDAAALTTFMYPVFSVSIVSVLIAVLLSRRRRVPRSMIIAGVAFAFAAVSDWGYTYLTVLHSYTDSSWLDLGWQVEAVLLCLAALLAARRSEGDVQRPELDRDVALLPALVAVLAVAGLALSEQIRFGRMGNVTVAVTMLLFLGLLLRQFIATRDRTLLAQQLQTAAITDLLTGLYNRRFFEERLLAEAALASRQRTPLSLILLDLDHFKDVNDTYGHSIGDAVLAEASARLRQAVRANDLIARYGGEEFVCLLPGTGEEAALDVAEHIRLTLSRMPLTLPDGNGEVRLTASLGVANVTPGSQQAAVDVDQLIKTADQALYRAKARGRDRVVGSGELPEVDLDPAKELPPELVWLADQIDAAVGDREHSTAVSRWSFETSARLGLDRVAQRRTAAAARLHDVGKVGISRSLLAKPTGLNAQEFEQVRRHPDEGARLLIELAHRPDLAALVVAHHERYDGCGYPRGLSGIEIPMGARIIAVCDAWAAMRADRSYSRVRASSEARRELTFGRGTQFDPVVVDAFLELVDEGKIDEPVRPCDQGALSRAAPRLRNGEGTQTPSPSR